MIGVSVFAFLMLLALIADARQEIKSLTRRVWELERRED